MENKIKVKNGTINFMLFYSFVITCGVIWSLLELNLFSGLCLGSGISGLLSLVLNGRRMNLIEGNGEK